MGEPAGIGGELTLKAFKRRKDLGLSPFFVIDDPQRLAQLAQKLDLSVSFAAIDDPHDSLSLFETALPVFPFPLAAPVIPGTPNPRNAPAVLKSIEIAVELVQRGQAAAVVTNPIHKQVLNEAGFKHPGHTEYLADLAGIKTPPVMMLACDELRVVPVTIHVSLADAAKLLTTDGIVERARITAQALVRYFGIEKPRLAVAGLNPHAGEGGQMGREDMEIVAPAVEALKAEGINAFGPLPADTMFHQEARATYDAAICMYHDQALIPIKTLAFDKGVNVTLGLPFIRTSPDHGTAFNLAGTGTAKETSLVAAMKMAAQMATNQ